ACPASFSPWLMTHSHPSLVRCTIPLAVCSLTTPSSQLNTTLHPPPSRPSTSTPNTSANITPLLPLIGCANVPSWGTHPPSTSDAANRTCLRFDSAKLFLPSVDCRCLA
ncbi:hypothetical protein DACRYDRAFT_24802, partial [Dacryopinax primogenitus]